MAQDVAYPVPIGVSTTFANLQANVATSTFSIQPDGAATGSDDWFTITFQPVDQNNPGTLTLTDGSGNVVATLNFGGYQILQTRGGSGFYFKATNGANIAALTKPSILY